MLYIIMEHITYNRYIEWIINFSIFILRIYFLQKKAYATFGKNYSIIFLYMIWMLIGCIRGLFACEIYMDFRWLTEGFQMLSLPILVFLFSNPYINQKILKKWFKYGLIIFGIYIIWVINIGAYHFYLGPIYLMGIIYLRFTKKMAIINIMPFSHYDNRFRSTGTSYQINYDHHFGIMLYDT